MFNKIEQAIVNAVAFHEKVLDKKSVPYIFHPLRVMVMAQQLGLDEEAQQIAVLHDVVEDTPCTLEHLRLVGFSERVVDGIDAMTRRNKNNRIEETFWNHIMGGWDDRIIEETYFDFVHRAAANSDARKIKMLDNADNMRPDRAVEGLKLGGRYKKSIEILKNACRFFHEDDYIKKFEELVNWV